MQPLSTRIISRTLSWAEPTPKSGWQPQHCFETPSQELRNPIWTRQLRWLCKVRSDALWFLFGLYAIIFEFDENQHPLSLYPDEAGRLEKIHAFLKKIPSWVLRLNGDAYTCADSTWHPSVFGRDNHGQYYVRHQADFMNRIWAVRNYLVELVERLKKSEDTKGREL